MADQIEIGIRVNSDAEAATRGLDKLNGSVVNSLKAAERLEKNYALLDKALLKKIITLDQYNKGNREVDAAIEAVINSTNRAVVATSRGAKANSGAAVAAQKLAAAQRMAGKDTNRFGAVAQQFGYQIGDFFVQVQSGTSALVAFGQQGTQLAGLLPGVAGAIIGIGISLGTALASTLFRTTKEVKSLGDSLSDLSNAIEDVSELNLGGIGESLQIAKKEAESFLSVLKSVRAEQLQIKLDAAIDSMGVASFLEDINQAVSAQFDAEAFSGVGRSVAEITNEIEKSSSILGLSATKARELDTILKSVGGTTKDEIAASFFAAVEQIEKQNLLTEETGRLIDDIASQLGLVESAYVDVNKEANSFLTTTEKLAQLKFEFSAGGKSLQKYGSRATTSDREPIFGSGESIYPSETVTGGGSRDALAGLLKRVELEKELLGTSEAYQEVLRAIQGSDKQYSESAIQGAVARVEALNREKELLEQMESQHKQIADVLKSSMESAFMSIVDGTTSAKDAFSSMAASIIKELYRVLVVQQMVGSFQSGGGGILGALAPVFGRASGGTVMSNTPYLVGERGPEIIVPQNRGHVMNADLTAKAMGNGGGSIVVNNNINVTGGSDPAAIRMEVAKLMPQITNATKSAVIDARKRGGQMRAAFQ